MDFEVFGACVLGVFVTASTTLSVQPSYRVKTLFDHDLSRGQAVWSGALMGGICMYFISRLLYGVIYLGSSMAGYYLIVLVEFICTKRKIVVPRFLP